MRMAFDGFDDLVWLLIDLRQGYDRAGLARLFCPAPARHPGHTVTALCGPLHTISRPRGGGTNNSPYSPSNNYALARRRRPPTPLSNSRTPATHATLELSNSTTFERVEHNTFEPLARPAASRPSSHIGRQQSGVGRAPFDKGRKCARTKLASFLHDEFCCCQRARQGY